jgi:hypothetical protein
LFDSGGNEDLTQGWHVGDIENVVLGQFNGVPVQIKDVAKVTVGYVPRLGIAGFDHDSDVALSIVVMGRTFHTNDVVPRRRQLKCIGDVVGTRRERRDACNNETAKPTLMTPSSKPWPPRPSGPRWHRTPSR